MFRLFQLELPFFGKPPAPVAPAPDERRTISLQGQAVDYTVRRSRKRRTLGLTIDTRGLRVAAPHKALLADIERLILTNARWVLAKLAQWRRPEHGEARAWSLADPLPLFGIKRRFELARGKPGLAIFEDRLILTVPHPDDEASARARLKSFIKEEARRHFTVRLAHYSGEFGAAMPALRLTRAATRWGSCARDPAGEHRVSLNWRMVHLEPRLIDYVIAHEVAHLKHMHHGPRFWAAVERLYPGYEAARAEMREASLSLPEL